jgi:hypothetical protein
MQHCFYQHKNEGDQFIRKLNILLVSSDLDSPSFLHEDYYIFTIARKIVGVRVVHK